MLNRIEYSHIYILSLFQVPIYDYYYNYISTRNSVITIRSNVKISILKILTLFRAIYGHKKMSNLKSFKKKKCQKNVFAKSKNLNFAQCSS